jgi:bla regulator protein BlaR1
MKKLLIALPENVSSALGFTLLHSLWQGALLLILFAGLHFVFKTSRTRYLLGMGALLSQTLLSLLTFIWIFEPARESELLSSSVLLPGEFLKMDSYTILHAIQSYIADNHQKFTFLWILGVSILLTRMFIGLVYTKHLKSAGTFLAPIEAEEILKDLAVRMKVKDAIALFESNKISSPLTIGWLKPVILFPVGMINGLSPAQVEAILAHELAHILRKDYILNILQSFVEVLFFFHPAVWAISHRVRVERENACDDMALDHCEGKLVLAHALAEVATFQSKPAFAMAFGARKYTLLDRVKRIVGINERQTPTHWLSLAMVLCLCFVAWSYAKEPETPVEITYDGIPLDTIPKTKAELKLEATAKEISEMSAKMNVIAEKMENTTSQMKLDEIEKLSEKIAQISSQMDIPSAKIEFLSEEIAALSLEIAAKKMRRLDTHELEKDLELRSAEMAKIQVDLEKVSEEMKSIHKAIEKQPMHDLQMQLSDLQAPLENLSQLMREKGNEIKTYAEVVVAEHESRAKEFSQKLKSTGLIKDADNYELNMIGDEIKINGKTLSPEESARVLELIKGHYRLPKDSKKLELGMKQGKMKYMITH